MKIMGDGLYKLKVIDGIIEEKQDTRQLLNHVKEIIYKDICRPKTMDKDDIVPKDMTVAEKSLLH